MELIPILIELNREKSEVEEEVIYLYEEMDSHLFQVVRADGQVIDKVDVLTAEGIANRLGKQGFIIQWIDRFPSKERKYVRNLISRCPVCSINCTCSVGARV